MSDDMIIPDFAALNREAARRKHSARARKAWVTRRKPHIGRPKLYGKAVLVRLPGGAKSRIDRALRPDENQSDFLRAAVERELQARGI